LGGNSLAEILVFGRQAGQAAAKHSSEIGAQLRSQAVIQAANDELDSFLKTGDELARPLQRALRNNMWENCGVVRDEARLLKGLETLQEIKAASSSVDVRPDAEGYQDLAIALDLRASISAAEVTLRSALVRQESRGAHQRKDFPDFSQEFNVNIQVRIDDNNEQVLTKQPISPVPASLQSWLEEQSDLPVAGRLLE
jgi:succinate dehydrogenase / fumarate reductase flavoprotein subunit